MWRDIFPKLCHIFNLLDNISIAIALESTYEIEKEIRGDNYMRIKILDLFVSDVIEKIRPFLQVKNVKISGCMCKICQDITFDSTIEDLGNLLEAEITTFKGYLSHYIHVLDYDLVENGKINPVVRDQKIFLQCLIKTLRHILSDLGHYFVYFTL